MTVDSSWSESPRMPLHQADQNEDYTSNQFSSSQRSNNVRQPRRPSMHHLKQWIEHRRRPLGVLPIRIERPVLKEELVPRGFEDLAVQGRVVQELEISGEDGCLWRQPGVSLVRGWIR